MEAKKKFNIADVMDDMVNGDEGQSVSRFNTPKNEESVQTTSRQEKILENEKKTWDRDIERPNKRNIGFDNVTWRKIKKVIDLMEMAGEKTTQQDVIYDAVVYWLDREYDNILEKYKEFND